MKQEAKRERLERAAQRAISESERRFKSAHDNLGMIPSGQPILVGHHSEKRHRRHLDRIDNDFRKGSEAAARARDLSNRAAAVGKGGISSDDPDAVEKLKAKLAKMEQKQELMKAVNAAIRKYRKELAAGDTHNCYLALERITGSAGAAKRALEPDAFGKLGFPSYALQNNNGNIRRVRQRIEALGKVNREAEPETLEVEGATITLDPGENRVFLRFPARLSHEAYRQVRRMGFVWNRTRSAFSRQLNGRSRWAAEAAAQAVAQIENPKGGGA